MKTKINSRSSNDLQWQEVKKKVRERDNITNIFIKTIRR